MGRSAARVVHLVRLQEPASSASTSTTRSPPRSDQRLHGPVSLNFPPRMKVNVWGINYAPEPTGIAPYNTVLCEHLSRTGHDVRMVTSFAYYPSWKKSAEDRRRLYRTDEMRNVPVHRCWHYVPAK